MISSDGFGFERWGIMIILGDVTEWVDILHIIIDSLYWENWSRWMSWIWWFLFFPIAIAINLLYLLHVHSVILITYPQPMGWFLLYVVPDWYTFLIFDKLNTFLALDIWFIFKIILIIIIHIIFYRVVHCIKNIFSRTVQF